MSRAMPLREHFRELRSRVLVCLLALLVGTAVCFYFYEDIYQVLLRPAYHASDVEEFKTGAHRDHRVSSASPCASRF